MLRDATGSRPLCLRGETGSIPVRSATGRNAKAAIGIPNPDAVGSIPTRPAAWLRPGVYGVLAHLVERFHGMEEVTGSTPVDSTLGKGVHLVFQGHDGLTTVVLR